MAVELIDEVFALEAAFAQFLGVVFVRFRQRPLGQVAESIPADAKLDIENTVIQVRIVNQLERLRLYFEERGQSKIMMKTNQLEASRPNHFRLHLQLIDFLAVLVLSDGFVHEFLRDLLPFLESVIRS